MPIYEYECRDCGHVFDALQKMSDQPLTDCPGCGQPGLRKLLSAPNFRLKGGGWYETDFKDKSRTKRNLADGEKSGDKAVGDSGGADKPAAAENSKDSGKAGSGSTSATGAE